MLTAAALPNVIEYRIPANALRCPALVAGVWRNGEWVPEGVYRTLRHHLTRGERVMICAAGDDPTSYCATFYCVRDFELRRFRVEDPCSQ